MTHSPAPWKAVLNSCYCDIIDANDIGIADSCASSCNGDMELGRVNARLMAAAPELLAVCQEIVRKYHTTKADNLSHLFHEARKAIQKATDTPAESPE